jgi:hypothetical protein
MKLTAVVSLGMIVMAGLSLSAAAQDKSSCQAFFQVVRVDTKTPEHFRAGMDEAQTKWWDNEGHKEYQELCLNGSVTAEDKPRYLVLWSKPDSIREAAVTPGEVFGQTTSAIQNMATKDLIYRPRWDRAAVAIVSISYEGNRVLTPVFTTTNDRVLLFVPDSPSVLRFALQYLKFEGNPDSDYPVPLVQKPAPMRPAPAPQPTLSVTLQASSTVLEAGQSATLSWSATNANALNVTPAIGTVAPSGTMSVSPTDSTNYTITATGSGGESSATVRITVSSSQRLVQEIANKEPDR